MTRKSTPLHIAIHNEMKDYFANYEYYSPLPSERELSNIFKVSRPTIRKSLELLEEENIIERIQGKGTFYLGNRVQINYSNMDHPVLGLSSVLSTSGKFTQSRVIKQSIEFPKTKVAIHLNLTEEDMVFHLKRLRFVDDDLYSLADDYIPLNLFPNIIDIDFNNHNLFDVLKDHDVVPYREDKSIEIRKANIKEATYLNLNENDPISITRIITYDKAGHIIQYATSKSNAYKSSFRIITTLDEA